MKVKVSEHRKIYIDILRIFACLLVIYNHTGSRGFYRYFESEYTVKILWELLVAVITKVAVPIFFMISGAMLLKKEESIKATYSRIGKIVIDLILFSMLYFDFDFSGGFSAIKQFGKMVIGTHYLHLWYLYAYIALIITLPFLRDFVKGLQIRNAGILYLVAVAVIGCLPIFEYFMMDVNSRFAPSWVAVNIFIYPVLGYLLEHRINIEKVTKKQLAIVWLVNILTIMISVICQHHFLKYAEDNSSETFLTMFCIVNAPVIFLTAKYLFLKINIENKKLVSFISEVGKCTYGIYLFHILFLEKNKVFYHFWLRIESGSSFMEEFGVFVSCIGVFMVSGIVTYGLRKIPFVKRLF